MGHVSGAQAACRCPSSERACGGPLGPAAATDRQASMGMAASSQSPWALCCSTGGHDQQPWWQTLNCQIMLGLAIPGILGPALQPDLQPWQLATALFFVNAAQPLWFEAASRGARTSIYRFAVSAIAVSDCVPS